MSSERIRVINEAQDIAKLRDKVLSEVTRLYFERRRVQVEMLLSPKRDTMGQVKQQLRLMELTASIDALTGGAFSQALKRIKPTQARSSAPAPAPSSSEEVDL
jgi:phosphoribosylaminoimidazole (AIR) synthetase